MPRPAETAPVMLFEVGALVTAGAIDVATSLATAAATARDPELTTGGNARTSLSLVLQRRRCN
ncbi:hypothetical protein [Mycobacterium simiae]|uniref:hypothetical protein n=1 Tax=Mycobacterium simiae TaxID=1784 RepID=UPI00165F5AF6|nr:hypothetical protein [Mycobacterium simiae]